MNHPATRRRVLRTAAVVLGLSLASICAAADNDPGPARIKHQITGLFMKEREQDLRAAVAKMPGVKLVSIDFQSAEAVFEYDPRTLFPQIKPAEYFERFNNLLRQASGHTFGIKPLRTIPLEKLQLVEIPVDGLDCKACCLAAYEYVARIDGVERATASFRDGKVTALIDPTKTDRAKLVEVLKKRGVDVKGP
jgi:copper chaperone CopZ